jgi:hypothetical protein
VSTRGGPRNRASKSRNFSLRRRDSRRPGCPRFLRGEPRMAAVKMNTNCDVRSWRRAGRCLRCRRAASNPRGIGPLRGLSGSQLWKNVAMGRTPAQVGGRPGDQPGTATMRVLNARVSRKKARGTKRRTRVQRTKNAGVARASAKAQRSQADGRAQWHAPSVAKSRCKSGR